MFILQFPTRNILDENADIAHYGDVITNADYNESGHGDRRDDVISAHAEVVCPGGQAKYSTTTPLRNTRGHVMENVGPTEHSSVVFKPEAHVADDFDSDYAIITSS